MGYLTITTPNFAKKIDKTLPSIFFDLDHTIIFPKNKKRFYHKTDPTDYVFRPLVIETFKKTLDDYVIYIVTNQIKYDIVIRDRIELVLRDLRSQIPGLNLCVIISTERDFYRKPAPGMVLESGIPGHQPTIIKSKSFHCGDAAGRTASGTGEVKSSPVPPADFSDDDLWFANHVGIKFFTPEEVFNPDFKFGRVTPYKPPKIEIDTILVSQLKEVYYNYDGLILVGLPGSGKSYVRRWYEKHFSGPKTLIVWNKDEKLPKSRMTDRLKAEFLHTPNAFHIFDNTNLREIERMEIERSEIKRSDPGSVGTAPPSRLTTFATFATMYIDIDRKEAIRGVKYRTLMEGGLYVPDVVINTMNKNKEPPVNPEILLLNKRPILESSFPPYLLI